MGEWERRDSNAGRYYHGTTIWPTLDTHPGRVGVWRDLGFAVAVGGTRASCASTAVERVPVPVRPRAPACPDVGVGGMNQAICIRGVEGAEMFFFESWCHPVYIPVIPDNTERLELNAGVKMFVRAHLRLGMNQNSRDCFDRPKSACSRFRGDAELGCLGSPVKRPRARSSRCASELPFSSEQVHDPFFEFGSGMNASPTGRVRVAASFCIAQRRRTEFLCSEKEGTARGTRGRFFRCVGLTMISQKSTTKRTHHTHKGKNARRSLDSGLPHSLR